MRGTRANRRDGNHTQIARELVQSGFLVQDTSDLGGGFPDLMVGAWGRVWLVEIKDPSQPPNKRKLTKAEQAFHLRWGVYGAFVAETAEEIIQYLKEQGR